MKKCGKCAFGLETCKSRFFENLVKQFFNNNIKNWRGAGRGVQKCVFLIITKIRFSEIIAEKWGIPKNFFLCLL